MRRLALLLALVGCQGGITITPTRGARTAVLVIVDDTAPAQGAELELHDGRERDGGHSVPQGGRLRYDPKTEEWSRDL